MQSIVDKLNAYNTELINEQIDLYTKLGQKWRLFGKSKLRSEIENVEKLRFKLNVLATSCKRKSTTWPWGNLNFLQNNFKTITNICVM